MNRARARSLILSDSQKYEEIARVGAKSSANPADEEEELSELEEAIEYVREAKKYVTLYVTEKRKVSKLEGEIGNLYRKLTNSAQEVIELHSECESISKKYEQIIHQMAKNQRITIERNSSLEIENKELKEHLSSIEERNPGEEEMENENLTQLRDQISSLIREKMELQEQLEDITERKKESDTEHTSQVSVIKKHFEEALLKNKELNTKVEQMNSQIQMYSTQMRIMQSQLDQVQNEKNQLLAKNQELTQEMTKLKITPKPSKSEENNTAKIIDLSTKNVSLQSENANLKSRITVLENQLNEIADKGDFEEDYEGRIETLEKVIENMRDKLNYYEELNRNRPNDDKIQSDLKRLKQLETERVFCNKEILESKQTTIDQLTQQNEKLQQDLDIIKQQNYDLSVEIGELKKRPDTMKSIVKMYTEKYQQTERARAELQRKLDSIKKNNDQIF